MNGAPASPRRLWLFGWLATFFTFVATAHGNFETTDAAFTMHAARVLWQRGDSGLLREVQGGDLLGEKLAAAHISYAQSLGARKDGKIGTNGRAYVWYPMGHVWMLAPLTAAAEAVAGAWPELDAAFLAHVAKDDRFAQLSVHTGTPVVMQGLISLLVPAAFAASTWLLLLLLARQLGAGQRAAAASSLAIVFATQCFALGRETLSDGPGLTLLLAALVPVVAVHQGRGSRLLSGLGGLAAGGAVLLRYQNAALMLGVGIALLLACRRQRRWRDLLAFTLGVMPPMLLFFATNHARFGDAFDTGYPKASDWLDQPIWLGACKILFAAGRGVAWFSPLVWLAVPLAWGKGHTPQLRWLAWVLFLFPLGFFAQAHGWQGGQCWAVRYVTHGLVALLAIVLPQAQPWRRWPKTWWLLIGFGLFANLTSVVAPVRGVLQLGTEAVEATSGSDIEAADITGWHPRYTPLLANWRYALASRAGGFEDENERMREGSPAAIATVFGVEPKTDKQRLAPVRWEDRCGRHLWWRFWGDVLGVSSWLLLLPTALLAALFAALAHRDFRSAASDSPTAR